MPATKRVRGSVREAELRRRYAALKHHQPFERVAAAFRPADLCFLLTDTDSLKLTYIADNADLPSGARLRQWVNARLIIAAHARLASNAGFTPETLAEALDIAVSIGPETCRQGWLETLIKYPRTRRFLRACAAAGIDGVWLDAAVRSGASFRLLMSLRKIGVPPRYLSADIIANCTEPKRISDWYASGISPWASARFISAGLSAGDAPAWLQAGFNPEEIIEFVSAEKCIAMCKAHLTNVPYSKAFRRVGQSRFGIAGPYVERVWQAVSALDAPSTYRSSMFSTASLDKSFLDGGYRSVSGYGFGSQS